jgi:hypothetical protein
MGRLPRGRALFWIYAAILGVILVILYLVLR